MKTLLLLLLLGAVLLAALAAEEGPRDEETIVKKVHEYVQQVAQSAKDALGKVQDSEIAQHAREWVSLRADDIHQFLGTLKDKFSALWEQQ